MYLTLKKIASNLPIWGQISPIFTSLFSKQVCFFLSLLSPIYLLNERILKKGFLFGKPFWLYLFIHFDTSLNGTNAKLTK